MYIEKVSRSDKIAAQLTKVISTALRHIQFDQKYTAVNVTRVCVSRDLKNARVYYTLFDALLEEGDSIRDIEQSLRLDLAKMRHIISQMIVMKYIPKLSFVYDKEHMKTQRVNAIIDALGDTEST